MKSKLKTLSNFCHSLQRQSEIYRPNHIEELESLLAQMPETAPLAYGHCLSYSDCHLWQDGHMIDLCRLNHILSFDTHTGIVICEPAVTFLDLLNLHPDWIPPIIPGTVHATLAGGIANDVHGKNNAHEGSLGHHILWLDLLIGSQCFHCSLDNHTDLFSATIAGLGLTGVIKRIALQMKQQSCWLESRSEGFTTLEDLRHRMVEQSEHVDYQAAWLDGIQVGKSILSDATHQKNASVTLNSIPKPLKENKRYRIPKLPVSLIHKCTMQLFNTIYSRCHQNESRIKTLTEFNNPLDHLKNWPNLYGRQGFIQFQAVFDAQKMPEYVFELFKMIKKNKAVASLVVLKYFTQPGLGLLSFTQPGFTLAIDLPNTTHAKQAVHEMNQFISHVGGKIYLAKDHQLEASTFRAMYPKHALFSEIRKRYACHTHSDLSKRLGLNQ